MLPMNTDINQVIPVGLGRARGDMEVEMTTCEKPRCPDAIRKYLHETDTCAIEGKMCLLESGTPCQLYEEFLAKADSEVKSRLSVEGK